MTNAEKYRLTGIEAYNLSQELGEYLTIEKKAEGVFVSDINSFFVRATKPTLTEDERVILRNTTANTCNAKSHYITRTKGSGRVRIKFKENGEEGYFNFAGFDHLFQFIKERRRI